MNLYAYVGGDPVNAVDPTGLWLVPAGKALRYASGTIVGATAVAWGGSQLATAFSDHDNREVESQAFGTDLSVAGAYAFVGSIMSGAGAVGERLPWLLGPRGPVFGSRAALNHNRFLRIGWSSHKGRRVFRAGGDGLERMTGRRHIDFFDGGPL